MAATAVEAGWTAKLPRLQVNLYPVVENLNRKAGRRDTPLAVQHSVGVPEKVCPLKNLPSVCLGKTKRNDI